MFDDLGNADPDWVGRIGRALHDDDAVGIAGFLFQGGGEALGELWKLEWVAVEDDAGGGDGYLDVFALFALLNLLLRFRKDLGKAGLRLHRGADEEEDNEDERDVRTGAGRRINEHLAAFQVS